MYKYMNKFLCLIATAVASYAVNMFYNINHAFAVIWETGTACTMIRKSTWSTTYSHTYCNGMSCTGCNAYMTNGLRESMSTALPGWGFVSCGCQVVQVYASVRASCAFASYKATSWLPTPVYSSVACGSVKKCDGTTVEIRCNTASPAGYRSQTGACLCCPSMTETVLGSFNVYANYDATSSADCYMLGSFSDSTGLFVYTDDNRCYYAS